MLEASREALASCLFPSLPGDNATRLQSHAGTAEGDDESAHNGGNKTVSGGKRGASQSRSYDLPNMTLSSVFMLLRGLSHGSLTVVPCSQFPSQRFPVIYICICVYIYIYIYIYTYVERERERDYNTYTDLVHGLGGPGNSGVHWAVRLPGLRPERHRSRVGNRG